MTTLTKQIKKIKAADMNGTATTPPIGGFGRPAQSGNTSLGELEGLFVGYGQVSTAFPYKMQNMYSSELHDSEIETYVLENEHLRAEFYPSLGGKLSSLFDKDAGRELLFANPVIRPRNLALRNAWMSGGVEWNCGIFGHHVHTCDQLFVAETALDDGTPVLRMYEYERIRRAVVQMDFFLPEGSKLLFARMRITNTVPEVTPMYWWSNIAVREEPDGRVITMADGSYVAEGGVSLIPLPVNKGVEVTYPTNTPISMDYFYKIPEKARKFECYVNSDGYGFVECSTSRLKGRKLFVWGQGAGGDRWQGYLTGEGDDGRYVELQAGLAHSQYECLPMPPKTTWEWLEGYGAISGDADKLHGRWKEAQAEASAALDGIITNDRMEEILCETYGMATSPAKKLLECGSGWGALENMRRRHDGEDLMTPHLDFGEVGEEQRDWVHLMEAECLPEHDPADVPPSYMLQPEWTKRLEAAARGGDRYNWYTHLHLGLIHLVSGDMAAASAEIERSQELRPSPWAVYALAHIALATDHARDAAVLAIRAALMRPNDLSLAKEAITYAAQLRMFTNVDEYISTLTDEQKACGQIKMYMLFTYVKKGDIEAAEQLFLKDGGINVPDIREGENTVTDLWLELEELKAKRDGREFDRNTAVVPEQFDFRMGVPREKPKFGRAADAQARADRGEA